MAILPRLGLHRQAGISAALLLLIGTVGPASGQSVISGRVLEDGERAPVGLVDLRVLDALGDTVASALSDNDGDFRLEVPPDVYTLLIRRVGYQSIRADEIDVARGQDLEVEVLLGLLAVPLDPVTVTARRRTETARGGLYRSRAETNRRLGRGRIYFRDDIEAARPYSAQHFLDGVVWDPRCQPVILLDNLPAEGLLGTVMGDELDTIEIYRRSTQIPLELYRPGMCGLVMVWTRADRPGMRPFSWVRAGVAAGIVLIIAIVAR